MRIVEWVAGGMSGAGVLVLAFTPLPLAAAGLILAGIALGWRAREARRDLIWHLWNDERGEDPDADESAHHPPGGHLRNGQD